MAVVNATEECEQWIESLSHREQKAVLQVVKILEQVGIALGEPYSSALKGTKHPLRELRPKRGASPLRIIYAFDPKREALLLIGGDKGTISGSTRVGSRGRSRSGRRTSRHWKRKASDEGQDEELEADREEALHA